MTAHPPDNPRPRRRAKSNADSPPAPIRNEAAHGRGAVSNLSGRFEVQRVVPFDDGWGSLDETPPLLRTTFTPEPARTILCTNDSPDLPFDRSINPYKGCEHGCVYCFARPTHAYLNLSPGLDFESRIFTKPHAPRLLEQALRKRGYACNPIAMGTNTDPYQPGERELKITRSIIEVFAAYGHPFTVVTKSNLILRDLDLLQPMARQGLFAAYLSVTTLDRGLARRMEPRAVTPERRLEALARLAAAGIPTGVMVSPVIPGINDAEVERILEAAGRVGVRSAGYMLLHLPHEVKQLFQDWLALHYPDRAAKVLSRLREMCGGRLYDPTFGRRMRGRGVHADLLSHRFELACRRLGLNRQRVELDCSRFRPPRRAGDQLTLFDQTAGTGSTSTPADRASSPSQRAEVCGGPAFFEATSRR